MVAKTLKMKTKIKNREHLNIRIVMSEVLLRGSKFKYSNALLFFFSLYSILYTQYCFSQNPDINLLKRINRDSSKMADKSFKFFSKAVSPVTIAAPIAMLYAGSFNEDGKLTRMGYKQAVSVLLAGVIGSSLKLIVKRPRPFKTYDFIHAKDRVGPNSFPSNHTAFAFATATSLSLAFPKWYVIGPAYLFAGLAAYSRMYLGVHFPIDLLGGIVIGIGSSILVWEMDRIMNGK